ncbi:unnamed protein product [Acanthoscelides obtectus]|uniref:DUF4817 domain-containing protein n=1 Tax=Acanthoscelides obtectus TaxID=200917 RepID=A0A9P0JLB6_ACAOB|nr:unnamed protein product [Acanthoscelides obtectus]CAK1662120.1 hypothetical protein AOBTE_LOCUS22996 [Acanthoscelides obtectus]
MTTMHFVYGIALGNARRARRMYGDRFPQRPLPNIQVQTFINIHARLCEACSFKRYTHVAGRPTSVRTIQIEEAVLNKIEEDPTTSV